MSTKTTTTYYPESNLTVVLHGTPEGMQKALDEFSAREAAKEAKRAAKNKQDLENECLNAILHNHEKSYAESNPEFYKLCTDKWLEEERKRNM